MNRTGFIERRGKMEDLDRSFDLQYWQGQAAEARASAAWELALHAARIKGQDVGRFRLQRAVETFQGQKR